MTWEQAWAQAHATLTAAGIADAEREVPLLLMTALGQTREELYRERPTLHDDEYQRFWALVLRRANREPMAYVRGRQEFYGLDLLITPRVLVPRPATEVLVDTALKVIPRRPGRVVDVGVGSGAVALALAQSGAAEWSVEGVDLDLQTLALAKTNRERLGLRALFYPSDLLKQVEGGLLAVVANLPYVGQGDEVDPEVRFEPTRAVYGGPRGPELVLRLVAQLPAKLAAGGVALLEVGAGQADEVAAAMAHVGLSVGGQIPDGDGVARVVWATWASVDAKKVEKEA